MSALYHTPAALSRAAPAANAAFIPCAAALFSYKSVTFYGQNPFGAFSTAKSPSLKRSARGEFFACDEKEGKAYKRGSPERGC